MKRFLLALGLPLLLAACTHTTQSTTAATMNIDTETLRAYHWQLLEGRNKEGDYLQALFVQKNKPVQLDFQERRFSISNTCNRLGGAYSVQDGKITFSQMVSTMMACANEKMSKLDYEISTRLTGTSTAALGSGNEPLLTLRTEDGDALTFIGRPTAETRYDGEGSLMFLEIAPFTQPCPDPLIAEKQCMQVRQVTYDDSGRKIVPSPVWQNFYQSIEGYEHQAGIRNILRVKRFKIANPPADASSDAYVLDLVVESEVVKR